MKRIFYLAYFVIFLFCLADSFGGSKMEGEKDEQNDTNPLAKFSEKRIPFISKLRLLFGARVDERDWVCTKNEKK